MNQFLSVTSKYTVFFVKQSKIMFKNIIIIIIQHKEQQTCGNRCRILTITTSRRKSQAPPHSLKPTAENIQADAEKHCLKFTSHSHTSNLFQHMLQNTTKCLLVHHPELPVEKLQRASTTPKELERTPGAGLYKVITLTKVGKVTPRFHIFKNTEANLRVRPEFKLNTYMFKFINAFDQEAIF